LEGSDNEAEEVNDMGIPTYAGETLAPETIAELRAMWDQLRSDAISDADRHEIDEIFSRQMP
jgi:hypothetical protein